MRCMYKNLALLGAICGIFENFSGRYAKNGADCARKPEIWSM